MAIMRRETTSLWKATNMRSMASMGWLVTSVAIATAAGCGPGTSTLSGTVTFNGEAVAKGSISLFPTDGKGSPAGGLIENGRYRIAGIAPGEKTVQLSAPISVGVRKDDYDDDTQTFEDLMPASWGRASQEKITVTAGSLTKNFEITGPDPRKKN
jgi:hypothetical protein